MDINLVHFIFLWMALLTGFVGLLVNFLEPYLPVLITRSYRYGKFSVTTYHPIVAKCEVPKRWYRHFYLTAAPLSTCTLCLVYYKYSYNGDFPEIIYWILDVCFGTSRQPLVSPASTILASVLICMHCWKRLYETEYVNVFSDKKMHLFHYIVGHVHYLGVCLSIIGESKGFVKGYEGTFSWEKLTSLELICAVIILLSSYAQLKANFILRDLRKNEDGAIVASGYKIPHGGLFEYTSGALQFTEIMIYIAISIILWQSSTYHYVTFWVIVNQLECAILTHQWYHRTFKNYPKSRKIVIPYLF